MSKADWQSGGPFTPFPTPVDFPDADIEDNPRVSLCFNAEWAPWVLGALKVLARSETWDTNQETSDALVEQAMRLQTLLSDGCGVALAVPNWHLSLALTDGTFDADLWADPQVTTVGGSPALHYRLLIGYANGVGANVTLRGETNDTPAPCGGEMMIHVETVNPALVEATTYTTVDCLDSTVTESAINTPYDVPDADYKSFNFVAGYFAESQYMIDIIIVGDYVCVSA